MRKHLERAEHTAKYYLEVDNLPEDGIPYWDFDDPDIPNAPRDASAATVIASACYELYRYTNNENYLDYANKVLANLQSVEYILPAEVKSPFILNHSTGNWPKKDEVDVPINYADYYFLEALSRKNKLDKL